MNEFVDTHLHVNDEKFDADRDAVIGWAVQVGVTTLVEIAESPDMWNKAVALAEKYPFIYAGLGIHPHHAHQVGPAEWPLLQERLKALAAHPKVVAIGEFGLDYFRMQNTKEQQAYLFHQQLLLAREVKKPVIIHCRDAHGDVQRAIQEFYPETMAAMDLPHPNGVIHCFSGTWQDAQLYMMHGFMLGFDGPVTYPSAKSLKEVVTRMPLQRMVLETDSPYLPPQTHRGQRNDPQFIPAIAAEIASLKRKTLSEVAQRTTTNARALFRI